MKKKGLIISTAVMVVVLIASLTTATFAWFSKTDAATVENLTISTSAAKGLQIAMRKNTTKSIDNIYSGDVTYDSTNGWWSTTPTWGSKITFSGENIEQLASMEHAVTKFVNAATHKVYKPVTGLNDNEPVTSYKMAGESAMVSGEGNYNSSEQITYYEDETSVNAGDYIVPIAYDAATKPIGYVKAEANGHYYLLTFAVTNLVEATHIGMSVEVSTSGAAPFGTVSATTPGMAAASRISVSVNKQLDTPVADKTAEYAPYSKYKLLANNTFSKGDSNGYASAKDGAENENGKYAITLDKVTTGKIAIAQVYYVNMLIWIEGTDEECVNATTGTDMSIAINFVYSENSDGIKTTADWHFTDGDETEYANVITTHNMGA